MKEYQHSLDGSYFRNKILKGQSKEILDLCFLSNVPTKSVRHYLQILRAIRIEKFRVEDKSLN